MKNDKLDKLFKQARTEPASGPSADFEGDVMRAIRNEPQGRGQASIFDELGGWFPRLAWVAALVIVLCVAADYGLVSSGETDLGEGVAQVSAHWFSASEGF